MDIPLKAIGGSTTSSHQYLTFSTAAVLTWNQFILLIGNVIQISEVVIDLCRIFCHQVIKELLSALRNSELIG